MFRNLLYSVAVAFGVCSGAYGATISIEIPDAQFAISPAAQEELITALKAKAKLEGKLQ